MQQYAEWEKEYPKLIAGKIPREKWPEYVQLERLEARLTGPAWHRWRWIEKEYSLGEPSEEFKIAEGAMETANAQLEAFEEKLYEEARATFPTSSEETWRSMAKGWFVGTTTWEPKLAPEIEKFFKETYEPAAAAYKIELAKRYKLPEYSEAGVQRVLQDIENAWKAVEPAYTAWQEQLGRTFAKEPFGTRIQIPEMIVPPTAPGI